MAPMDLKDSGFSSLIQVFLIAAICITFMIFLIRSTYGRAFKAIREDEIAAEAMELTF